ncbi:MAG: nuclear transport factor 2 family protein [Pseudomonadota bacterium]
MKSFVSGLFFLTISLATILARGADANGVAAVLRLDQARLSAMIAGDGAALGRLFSDAVVFIHSDGRAEGKMDYIKSMTAGDTAYANVKTSAVQAQTVTPDVIVLTGAQDMRKKLGPTWSDLNLRFMSVWRNEGGTWRMISWQSLRPAGNSVVPTK